MRKRHILVLNSYPDPPPPLSEILYPPLTATTTITTIHSGAHNYGPKFRLSFL